MPAPPTVNPFDLLGLPPTYKTEASAVQAAYLARAAKLHPDLAASDPDARKIASASSASLNDARNTLLDPETRAEAMIVCLGGEPSAEARAGKLAPEFLMEIMELRERIQSELADPDDPGARERWEKWSASERDELVAKISELFARAESDETCRAEVIAEIRVELTRLRYVQRLIDQLDPDDATAQIPGIGLPGGVPGGGMPGGGPTA